MVEITLTGQLTDNDSQLLSFLDAGDSYIFLNRSPSHFVSRSTIKNVFYARA